MPGPLAQFHSRQRLRSAARHKRTICAVSTHTRDQHAWYPRTMRSPQKTTERHSVQEDDLFEYRTSSPAPARLGTHGFFSLMALPQRRLPPRRHAHGITHAEILEVDEFIAAHHGDDCQSFSTARRARARQRAANTLCFFHLPAPPISFSSLFSSRLCFFPTRPSHPFL